MNKNRPFFYQKRAKPKFVRERYNDNDDDDSYSSSNTTKFGDLSRNSRPSQESHGYDNSNSDPPIFEQTKSRREINSIKRSTSAPVSPSISFQPHFNTASPVIILFFI